MHPIISHRHNESNTTFNTLAHCDFDPGTPHPRNTLRSSTYRPPHPIAPPSLTTLPHFPRASRSTPLPPAQGLAKFIADYAPRAVREVKFENYFGRTVAIDASMHIYQFMVVVGRVGDQTLTNESGEVTAHLNGMFYRTVRMLEAGIKPVYVFEGAPPEMKFGELVKRKEKRKEAQEGLEKAKEEGNEADIEKFAKRNVRVTKEHNEDCKRLLRLMGVPVIEAPGEVRAVRGGCVGARRRRWSEEAALVRGGCVGAGSVANALAFSSDARLANPNPNPNSSI